MKVQQVPANNKEAISFSLNETHSSTGENTPRISIPLTVFDGQGRYHLTQLTLASIVLSWPKVHLKTNSLHEMQFWKKGSWRNLPKDKWIKNYKVTRCMKIILVWKQMSFKKLLSCIPTRSWTKSRVFFLSDFYHNYYHYLIFCPCYNRYIFLLVC